MIAEFFYPQELKDVIAELRAKGDLNEGALKNLEVHLYKQLIILIIASLFLYQFFSFFVFPIAAIIFIGFIFYDFKKHLSQKIFPYLFGSIRKLTIIKRKSYRFGIVLILEDEKKKVYITPLLKELWKLKNFKEGKSFDFYVVESKLSNCMPDEILIRDNFCLTKNATDKEIL